MKQDLSNSSSVPQISYPGLPASSICSLPSLNRRVNKLRDNPADYRIFYNLPIDFPSLSLSLTHSLSLSLALRSRERSISQNEPAALSLIQDHFYYVVWKQREFRPPSLLPQKNDAFKFLFFLAQTCKDSQSPISISNLLKPDQEYASTTDPVRSQEQAERELHHESYIEKRKGGLLIVYTSTEYKKKASDVLSNTILFCA